jgi:hypothetical protein
MVNLTTNVESKTKTKTIHRRDISRLKVADLEDALETKDWSSLYNTSDANEAVTTHLKHVEEALDIVAPVKAIKIRPDKPQISLKRDTLATMASRDKARKAGDRDRFKTLRNTVIKLVKRDKIRGVLSRLKKNPGPQSAWNEAKAVLGRGRGVTLPDCTTNCYPKDTADHQNKFFVDKIARLVSTLPSPNQEVSGRVSGGDPERDDSELFSDKKTPESNSKDSKMTFSFNLLPLVV